MNKIRFYFVAAFLALVCGEAMADGISIGDVSITAGKTQKVQVALEQSGTAYAGFQFDLVLPEGLTLKPVEGESLFALESSLTGDMECSANVLDDGSIRFIAYSETLTTVAGNGGVVMNLLLAADESTTPGTYSMELNNVILSDADGKTTKQDDSSVNVAVKDPNAIVMGDVNGDGVVTISDVLMTINASLGNPAEGFNKDAGDMNNDGSITISDVLMIINLSLSQ